jgi:hypothetical protein
MAAIAGTLNKQSLRAEKRSAPCLEEALQRHHYAAREAGVPGEWQKLAKSSR